MNFYINLLVHITNICFVDDGLNLEDRINMSYLEKVDVSPVLTKEL